MAEAPDVDLRRTTRSLDEAKPGLASGWGQCATVYFGRVRSHTELSYGENKGLLPGVTPPPVGFRFRRNIIPRAI